MLRWTLRGVARYAMRINYQNHWRRLTATQRNQKSCVLV